MPFMVVPPYLYDVPLYVTAVQIILSATEAVLFFVVEDTIFLDDEQAEINNDNNI